MTVTIQDVARLWGQLTSLKIDIALLKAEGTDSDTLRARQMQSLQVAHELREACNRIVHIRQACGRQLQ